MSDKPEQQSLGLNAEEKPLERVDEYRFEPIKGYPMLHWHGKRPFTATQYFPAQHKETHGSEIDGWRNKIYWGDNLQVMSHLLKEYRGRMKLIYIDPPFDSKADYKKKISLRGKTTSNDLSTFEEKQYTDIWTNDEYLQFMYERIILIKELLADNGAFYLHCDWHRSHYLRCILDEVFGAQNFINEIIWKRASTVKGNYGQGTIGYGANTDTIYFYSKSENVVFNPQYMPYSNEYINNFYKYIDEDTGRKYRLISMIGPGGADKGNPRYEVMGITRYWRYSKTKMQKLIDDGLVVQTNPGTVPQRKLYLDQGDGVAVQNLWNDIGGLGASSSERYDYPTQKPEALLERIILASSNPGDLIFDCFMGSGTTAAVAMKLGRRFVGADINLGAVQTITKRLIDLNKKFDRAQPELMPNTDSDKFIDTLFTGFSIYNVNRYDVFRNPIEARNLLIQAFEINPLSETHLFDGEKDGRMVKIMPVNRIATREDLNPLLNNMDFKAFEKRHAEHPNLPIEKITLVCMGHEPDLAAHLQLQVKQATGGASIDVEVVDILRDKQDLQFKRDSEAKIVVKDGKLIIEKFYPMNLLSKLSIQAEKVDDWREMVESVMIDWNYDGAVLQPAVVDVPDKNSLVNGEYTIPDGAGTIRIKITDLLSDSLEQEVQYG